MAPCPAAGMNSSGSRMKPSSGRPRRINPALASTMASNSPCFHFRMRVGTLPRRSLTSRSGRLASSCAVLRTLEEPITAPRGSCSSGTLDIRMSSTGARGSTAATSVPGVGSTAMSFRLFTATSISPASSRSSSSLTKAPKPPSALSGRSLTMSPVVLTCLISMSISGWRSRMASITMRVCVMARSLALVPMIILSPPARHRTHRRCGGRPRRNGRC